MKITNLLIFLGTFIVPGCSGTRTRVQNQIVTDTPDVQEQDVTQDNGLLIFEPVCTVIVSPPNDNTLVCQTSCSEHLSVALEACLRRFRGCWEGCRGHGSCAQQCVQTQDSCNSNRMADLDFCLESCQSNE